MRFNVVVVNGGYSFKVNCSIIYLSFMNPALIKTIILLMMSSFLPVHNDPLLLIVQTQTKVN